MKKITVMVGVVIVLMSCSAGRVQSQPTYDRNDERYDNCNNNGYDNRNNNGYDNQSQRGFDFFPSANVYFDISFNRYWFMRGGTWASSPFLPPGIMINRNQCQRVYYNGPDVWRDNNRHRDRWCRNDNNGYNRSNDWEDNDGRYGNRRNDRRYDRRDGRWNRGRGRGW